jgi:short-subunit dehydrogenase
MAWRNIAGLRVIVTGASSGIGRELVKQLIVQGAKVVAIARRQERLEELAAELACDERLAILAGDVTQAAIRVAAFDLCESRFGGLDALVNNAGIGSVGPFEENDEARLREVLEVNFFAPAAFIRAALPLLRKGNKPLIVNVSSVLGHRAIRGMSEYCASKFALHGLSDALRAELASEGIGVTLISPSTTASEFFDSAKGDRSSLVRRFGAMTPASVAKHTLRAMRWGRHEIILTPGGKLLVWLDRLCPPIMNRLIAWFS